MRTEDGQLKLDTPRDRKGDFEPQLVKKHQTRFTSRDDKILFLYAQGMTTREIVDTFKEMYGADVSASLISKVTDAITDQVIDQNTQLWLLFSRPSLLILLFWVLIRSTTCFWVKLICLNMTVYLRSKSAEPISKK